MHIAVIDGQGGGIGRAIIDALRKNFKDQIVITALGTNALASSNMQKAGCDYVASGENAVKTNVKDVDVIIGVVGILSANSMLGELTPKMAKAIGKSAAIKVLIPLNRCNLMIAGTRSVSLSDCITDGMDIIRGLLESKK